MYLTNDNEFPDSARQVSMKWSLWQNKDLDQKAPQYVRENPHVKSRPNMTAHDHVIVLHAMIIFS